MRKGKMFALLCAASSVAILSLWKVVAILKDYKEGKDLYRRIGSEYTEMIPDSQEQDVHEEHDVQKAENPTVTNEATVEQCPVSTRSKETKAPLTVDWEGLKAANPDVIGWIYVEAIPDISYPVVQGKDDAYYVDHAFDGQETSSGCIFAGNVSRPDFSSPQTFIYGHNMRNGTMFSKLHDHRNDGSFDTNPYIWILTPEKNRRYEAFSIFETGRSSDVFYFYGDGMIHYRQYVGEMAGRNTFLQNPAAPDLYANSIILVTCVPDTYNRTVVFCKEIENN